jgi:hypothetical protein
MMIRRLVFLYLLYHMLKVVILKGAHQKGFGSVQDGLKTLLAFKISNNMIFSINLII